MNIFFHIDKFFQLKSFMLLLLSKTIFANINTNIGEPEFLDAMQNITVAAGRSAKFVCSVKNLGSYKIAWMHVEKSAILAVQNHVITRNPRISVSHDKHRAWFLNINNVQEEDEGKYMCQINTASSKSQYVYLHVVVPPNIDDDASSSDVLVREFNSETLKCKATGLPTPHIKWRRTGGRKIKVNGTFGFYEWEGEALKLTRISRLEMGDYLCIASNGIPPTVSKIIRLKVDFAPAMWIPHQLVGAPIGYNVTLECNSEAFPTSLNYWMMENGEMIHNSHKYHVENIVGNPFYKTNMRLTITDINLPDFGTYKCIAKNSIGETGGTIRVYVSTPPKTTTITVTTIKIKTTEKLITTIYYQGKRSENTTKPNYNQNTWNFKDSKNKSIINRIGGITKSKSNTDMNIRKVYNWSSKHSQDSTASSVTSSTTISILTISLILMWFNFIQL